MANNGCASSPFFLFFAFRAGGAALSSLMTSTYNLHNLHEKRASTVDLSNPDAIIGA